MIDLVLVVLIVSYAISGYRQGIAVGALSLIGFLGGALVSMWVVPPLADRLDPGMERSIVILVAVLLFAWLGQLGGALLGGRLRERLTLPAVRAVDQALGAVAGVVAVSLVLWFVGNALRGVEEPTVARAVAQSRVLAGIDKVVPRPLAGIASQFQDAVASSGFPRVFEGVAPERIVSVAAPDPTAMSTATQAKVRQSVVKVEGQADACRRGQEGSGVVVSAQRVVTNAHVVAAVDKPRVQLATGGQWYDATVVLFDPVVDIAVLAVPQLRAPAVPLGADLGNGADAVVAGYPLNGPYTAVPARIRSVIEASGEDIYGRPGAVRQVYSLYARVQQGNSGGPLFASTGSLAGIVFAQSLDDRNTGYALTMTEVKSLVSQGISAGQAVPTGGCAVG